MNLLALTSCCVDFYPQINKSFFGGNSLNVASMWKTLVPQENNSNITCLSNDSNAKMIIDFLIKKKIDISRVYQKDGSTACNKLRVDDDGERYGIEGSWNGGVYESFFLSKSDWAFVSKQDIVAIPADNPNFNEMIIRKHSQQMISVDYLDIANNLPLQDTLECTDIAYISANTDALEQYKEIAFLTEKLLVVTLGSKGSYAFYKGESFFHPAIQVNKIIDTTGCGDAYQAAFAVTFLKTKDIQLSMHAAAKAASIILQAWGGVGINQ